MNDAQLRSNTPLSRIFMAQNGATQPSSPPPSRISLAQPRPDGARVNNYYTETPFRPPPTSKSPKNDSRHDRGNDDAPDDLVRVHTRTTTATRVLSTTTGSSAGGDPVSRVGRPIVSSTALVHNNTHRLTNVVTSQQPKSLKTISNTNSSKLTECGGGGGDSDLDDVGGLHGSSDSSSVLCKECGLCKCDACRNPRPLPSKWICNDKCECSAEALLDMCTCMCCVKGLFYHCVDDYDGECADKPCSCAPRRRCLRWGCMGVLAVVLPCLLCYWPLRGCVHVTEKLYQRRLHGCRCHSNSQQQQQQLQQQQVAITTTQRRSNNLRVANLGDQTITNKRLLDEDA